MSVRLPYSAAVRRSVSSQCGAPRAQFQVAVTPRVASPSGRLTRGYAWCGPPGRTWPLRRHDLFAIRAIHLGTGGAEVDPKSRTKTNELSVDSRIHAGIWLRGRISTEEWFGRLRR